MGWRRLIAARNQLLDRQAARVGQQQARFETDIVEARGRQGRRRVAQQAVVGRDRTGQAASSARRPASSSAISASMISSSALPSITFSSS